MKNSEILLGRLLFGRPLRLRLGIWIAEHEGPYFYQREAAEGIGFDPGHVSRELETFVDLGMIVRIARERGNAPQYYSRTSSRAWDIFKAAKTALADIPDRPPRDGPRNVYRRRPPHQLAERRLA